MENNMRRVIINENQMGFLFKNGKYVRLLTPGKYYEFGGREIEIAYDLQEAVSSAICPLETLLGDPEFASKVDVVEVGDESLALHYVNGSFKSVLKRGKYAFWNVTDSNEFRTVDISSPFVDGAVPAYVFDVIPHSLYQKLEVAEYENGLVYVDKKLERVLDAGTYYFWKCARKVECRLVDRRLTQMNVTGQEVLSADKVTLRINLVLRYRITDCVKAVNEVDDFEEQLHVATQLALRSHVGRMKLDEILENKEEISALVFNALKVKESELFVEITEAGVRDIILPGEIRDIMNTVLVAEKKAQANVIARREEVASTRSLLNTARMMDENKTLYKLKELEYVERICENVGSINLHGGGDLLSQLASVLRSE